LVRRIGNGLVAARSWTMGAGAWERGPGRCKGEQGLGQREQGLGWGSRTWLGAAELG
jgi:hypothetical protein